jgi:hypothetical protein
VVAHTTTLLLLDVDGVLVHPVGYKNALRATVDYFAARMGQPSMGPSDDEIAIFEACGLTNEWDSSAVCLSALLLAGLDRRPDLYRATLDATLDAIRAAELSLQRPDFVTAARRIYAQHQDSPYPAANYLKLLAHEIDAAQGPLFLKLLANVYDVLNTPTTRVFQTHTLGSAVFAKTYGQPAPFESESFLTTQDVPLLNATNRAQLLAWQRDTAHGVALFTARPSLPPADLPDPVQTIPSDGPTTGYAPEAELATDLLGVDGQIPLIGQGRVSWLAIRHGRGVGDYIKPSPVQALAGIGAALSGAETDALRAAGALYEHGELTGPLAAMRDSTTRVVVFEDSVGGIRAARGAVDHLTAAGLDVQFEAIGVSPNVDKRAVLLDVAESVVDDINAGLALIWS